MKAGSLFAGIGGFDLALQRAGIATAWQAEIDPWCLRVLARHFPEAKRFDDVRSVGAASATPVDLLCGGFPCQDLSVAGKRAGLGGERSGLFYEVARIADELRPRWLLLENVPGLLSSQGGRDFRAVLETLDGLGYGLAWRVLDSQGFGVPQRRRRVFVVGHLGSPCPPEVFPQSAGLQRHPLPNHEAGPYATANPCGSVAGGRLAGALTRRNGDSVCRDSGAVVAFSHTQGLDPQASEDATPTLRREGGGMAVALAEGFDVFNQASTGDVAQSLVKGGGNTMPHVREGLTVRRLTPTECERLQGFPDGWTAVDGEPVYAQTPAGKWRCKSGTPDAPRYAALGNAVTVNVVEWIVRRIAAADLLGLGLRDAA